MKSSSSDSSAMNRSASFRKAIRLPVRRRGLFGLPGGVAEGTDRHQQSRDDLLRKIHPPPQEDGQADELPARRGTQQVAGVIAESARLGIHTFTGMYVADNNPVAALTNAAHEPARRVTSRGITESPCRSGPGSRTPGVVRERRPGDARRRHADRTGSYRGRSRDRARQGLRSGLHRFVRGSRRGLGITRRYRQRRVPPAGSSRRTSGSYREIAATWSRT